MQKSTFLLIAGVWVTGLLPGLASGAAVNPFDASEGFNIVVNKDFANNAGHSEGAVAVGGVLTFKTSEKLGGENGSAFRPDGVGAPTTDLIVGGGVDWANSTGELLVGKNPTGGYVKIHGASTVHPWNPGETVINNSANPNQSPRIMTRADQTQASVSADSGFDFSAKDASFKQASADIAGLAATRDNASIGLTGGLVTLNDFKLSNGLNVFNMTGLEWNSIQNINWNGSFVPGDGRQLIVNIDLSYLAGLGSAANYNFGLTSLGLQESSASDVLFNFYNYKGTISFLNNVVIGSILAPFAHLNKGSPNIVGQIYARSMDLNGGEVHMRTNRVTYEPPPPPCHSVPDSSATGVGAIAVLGLLLVRRRSQV